MFIMTDVLLYEFYNDRDVNVSVYKTDVLPYEFYNDRDVNVLVYNDRCTTV